jgi:hypothetical protein
MEAVSEKVTAWEWVWTSPHGIGVSHAVLQLGRHRESHAAGRPARHQQQTSAVVDQMLVARQVPERKALSIGRRIGVGIELHHAIVVGKPGRVRVTRIQSWVFQQAQAPAPRCAGIAATA